MKKVKASSVAPQPTVQESVVHAVAPAPAPGHECRTHWQGGNPFDRMELFAKADKAARR